MGISWIFNGALVANTSRVTIHEEAIAEGQGTFKQSFLQLSNLALSDAGSYTCVISNGLRAANSTVQLLVVERSKFPVH